MADLVRGQVVMAWLDPTIAREQAGHRPLIVVSSTRYLATVTALVIAVPVTSKDRGWANHVRLAGPELTLTGPSWAMTEQPRTISRERITATAGRVDDGTLAHIDQWLSDFLGL